MARPIRDSLNALAAHLTTPGQRASGTQRQEWAADLHAVLSPGGWAALKDTDPAQPAGESRNLPVQMPLALREAVHQAAGEIGVDLATVVADGFRAVLEGRYTPPPVQPGIRNMIGEKRNLNVRVPVGLLDPVGGMLEELSERAGYRVSRASIVTSWLMDELGVEMPVAGALKLVLPTTLKAHFIQAAKDRGVELQQVMEDGIRDMVSGAWVFPNQPTGPRGRAVKTARPREVAKLTIPVEQGLLEEIQAAAPRLVAEYGRTRIFPGTIAIALLKDRLGEPAE